MRVILIGLLLIWPAIGMAQVVDNVDALRAAIDSANPGDVITLAPGVYRIDRKVTFDRAGAVGQPITVRAESTAEVTIEVTVPEGFHVRAAHWSFENLHFRGVCNDDSTCEHAFHITGLADNTTVKDCLLEDFNAQIKGNGAPANPDGSYTWPDDVLIEYTELFNNAPRNTDSPVTPIDVVGGRRWIIRGNYIHDHAKGGGNNISYAAFLKGNSRDGLFERNLVVCERLHHGQIRLGLSFGGGGSSPDRICEDGTCTPEHQGGVMRNNMILNCPTDVGFYINKGQNVSLLHNTLINTGGIDLRFDTTIAEVRGNLLDGRIRERNGGQGMLSDNLQQVPNLAARFADVNTADLTLLDGTGFVNAAPAIADFSDDYCGRMRDGQYDIGAIEYTEASPCNTAWPPKAQQPHVPDAGVPDAGVPDTGVPDAAVIDIGGVDTGMAHDMSTMTDALLKDVEVPTDGQADADYALDQGSQRIDSTGDDDGCAMTDRSAPWLGLLMLLVFRRRRE